MTSEIVENKPQQTPGWLIPGYPSLRGDDLVGQAAVAGQLVHYPKVVRTMTDPPLTSQKLACVSFMLFKESRKLSNGVPVYGYVKMRGNWADESQATFEASKIIKEVDSKYPIRVAPVGAWVPITDEEAFVKDHLDVRMNDEEIHLRDAAVKEKMADQRRIKRELEEREAELKSGDISDDPTSLTYYSMRRVTENVLMESYDRQLAQFESTKKILHKVRVELKKLEVSNPEYIDQWIDRYDEERKKAGIPNYVPSEEQEDRHVSALKEINLEDGPKTPDEITENPSFFQQ